MRLRATESSRAYASYAAPECTRAFSVSDPAAVMLKHVLWSTTFDHGATAAPRRSVAEG